MNKILAGILAVSMTAGLVSAQEPVLSRNAVGYIKVEAAGDPSDIKLYLVANPFLSLDGSSIKVTNLFANLPANGSILAWDTDAQTYIPYAKSARGAWVGDAVNATIEPGEGVFVRIPAGAAGAEFVLMGEVPDADVVVSRAAGLTLAGFPFPAEVKLTNTVMASALPNNSSILVWDGGSQSYLSYAKSARGVWIGDAATASFVPGTAYFILSTTPADSWTETKPYTWP